MLNEFAEFEAYTMALDNIKTEGNKTLKNIARDAKVVNLEPLLRRSASNKGGMPQLNGIERPMSIIARFFLFDDSSAADCDPEDRIRRADAALHLWCGLVPAELDPSAEAIYDNIKSVYPDLNGWLQEYTCKIAPGFYDDMVKVLKGRRGHFSKNAFQMMYEPLQAVSYEKIIANAVVAGGPLSQYYLVCKCKDWERDMYKKTAAGEKRLNDKDRDRILKMTAAILIGNKRRGRAPADLTYHNVNRSALSIWIGTRVDGSAFNYCYQRTPAFESRKLSRNEKDNGSEVRINKTWLDRCGWAIIDATEGDDELDAFLSANPDGIYFRDNIPGVLEKNKRYSSEKA